MDNTAKLPKEGLFSATDDFINMTEVTRTYPTINEIDINSSQDYKTLAQIIADDTDMIPLFVKGKDGGLDFISSIVQELERKSFEACKLVYLGKPITEETLEEMKQAKVLSIEASPIVEPTKE
jgi:hypothetical protein